MRSLHSSISTSLIVQPQHSLTFTQDRATTQSPTRSKDMGSGPQQIE